MVGTTIDYQIDYKKEPFQHYLARQISPSIGFVFQTIEMDGKRIVVPEIPAAVKVPTAFDGTRHIRIF